MGLERISVVMQNVNSIFEIDTMREIINKIADGAEINYGEDEKKDIAIRIIADHMKAAVFMIADDIFISNEGRGYILRRLIRRAFCRIKILNIEKKNFLAELIELVVKIFGGYYKNLADKKDEITKIILEEEKKFNDVILGGLNIFMDLIEKTKEQGKNIISGKEAFKLHDTFGFNMDLMKEFASENEVMIDEKEFEIELEKQKERARKSQVNKNENGFLIEVQEGIKKLSATEFIGYENFEIGDAKIVMLIENDIGIKNEIRNKEQEFYIIFDKTIFFAEESGQISDSGILKTETGEAKIIDCKKIFGDKYIHKARLISGFIKLDQAGNLKLDFEKRFCIARNHTATHLLHKILREKIFDETKQMGSYIDENYFRFDFLCKKVLSAKDLDLIENELNKKIFESLDIKTEKKGINEAINSGATALFDEKYGDIVRVVKIGNYSQELCSGTHVKNTAQINCFKIIGESGVSAGIRRIEAVTGPKAIDFCNKRQKEILEACVLLKADKNNFLHKLKSFIDDDKKNKNKIARLENILSSEMAKKICDKCELINNINFVFDSFDDFDLKFLRDVADKIKNKLKKCVVVLVNKNENKINLIFSRTDDLDLNANEIIKNLAYKFGGNGGGKKNYAQLGGINFNDLNLVVSEIKNILLG